MFIPERAPYDLYDKFYEKKNEIKLFVRRVLVSDEFEDMLPKYMNFIKAIVDSDSLSLKVNRENIKDRKILKSIGGKLVKKAIDMLLSFDPGSEED